MMAVSGLLVCIIALLVSSANGLRRVKGQIPDHLDIEPGSISTSGVSAGAAMAIQIHVAHSAEVKGAASFAGSGPYFCAAGSLTFALGRCMTTPANVPVDSLISETESFATAGDIDDTTNLQGSKVFIWHGAHDDVVHPGESVAIEEYYVHYGADIQFPCMKNHPAGHCQPIEDNGAGIANEECAVSDSPYINDCDYDGAFVALNHIYNKTLTRPSRPVEATGELIEFAQRDYIANPGSVSLGDSGFMYVPTACNSQACKLHIALHGCVMDYDTIGSDYVSHGGYNEVADVNNIIILYPQAARSLSLPNNPNGCFDWWGYNDGLTNEYTTKSAPQIEAIWSMATSQRLQN